MYEVVGRVRSRGFRVLWALEEMGVAYKHVDVGPHSDEALAYHPAGKIPVMKDGDAVLTDSVAIMSYLSDKHGQLGAQAGTVARARLDAMLHQLNETLDAPLWMIARHTFILPEEKRCPEAVAVEKELVARSMHTLGEGLTGPFLMGDHFTIADILCVHCLNWAFGMGIAVEHEKLKAYAKEMRARPAFTKAGQS
jgi:glutathione S-transferase